MTPEQFSDVYNKCPFCLEVVGIKYSVTGICGKCNVKVTINGKECETPKIHIFIGDSQTETVIYAVYLRLSKHVICYEINDDQITTFVSKHNLEHVLSDDFIYTDMQSEVELDGYIPFDVLDDEKTTAKIENMIILQ